MKTQDKWKKSFSHQKRSHHEKFWEKVDKKSENDCWMWLGHIDRYGYGKFWNFLSHRFSWIDTFGNIPDGLYVCHKCDNPSCVNPRHLFLGTQLDNMQDMVKKGRIHSHIGEDNPKSKLSERDIYKIYRLYDAGLSGYKIAKMFLVSKTNILGIVRGKTWRHLYGQVTHVR